MKAFADLGKVIAQIVKLDRSEIDLFLEKVTLHTVNRKEKLIASGDLSDRMYFIQSGVFRSYFVIDSKEVNTAFYFERMFASAFTSFINRQITSMNLEAIRKGKVYVFSKDHLESFYDRNPMWYALGKHIYEVEFAKRCDRVTNFLTQDALHRYLALIRQHPDIETKIPGYHIASYLGIAPESFSRIRSMKVKALRR